MKDYSIQIPHYIATNNDLSHLEKLLYGDIYTQLFMNGSCYSTNKVFSQKYGVDRTTISRLLNNLAKLGFIKMQIFYVDDTKEFDKRKIEIV